MWCIPDDRLEAEGWKENTPPSRMAGKGVLSFQSSLASAAGVAARAAAALFAWTGFVDG
jgi:hypothetical protein